MRFVIELLARLGWRAKNVGEQDVYSPPIPELSMASACLETFPYIRADTFSQLEWLSTTDGLGVYNSYRDLPEFTQKLEEFCRFIHAGASVTATMQNTTETVVELSEFAGRRGNEYISPMVALAAYLKAAEKLCTLLQRVGSNDISNQMRYYSRVLTPTLQQILDLNRALMAASGRIRRLP